jgi:tight adherence protein B
LNPVASIFFVVLSVTFALVMLLTRPALASEHTRRRLVVIQESVRPRNAGAYGTELKATHSGSARARLGSLLERYQFAQGMKLLIVHADSRLDLGAIALMSLGCAALGGLVSFVFLHVILLSVALAAAGCGVPYGVLKFKRGRRLKAFNNALPDAIDLIARSLRAGHAMGSAIEMVAEQAQPPLGFEFFQVFQQQRLGLQFRDALLEMGGRVPSRDLQFLITAILVQKETGGDLTEILDRAAHVIRERVRIEGEVRTRTAQGRLTGWILGLLPVIMLVLINLVSPGYSSLLFHDPVGQKLLYTGGSLILVGGLIIRKIVDIQV